MNANVDAACSIRRALTKTKTERQTPERVKTLTTRSQYGKEGSQP
jgi:hypothetical protein